MPNPVNTLDLAARFRPLNEAEEESADALLNDAWAVVLGTVPDIEARMTSGAVSRDVVAFVVSAMALRVLRNPNGVRQWSVDDYSETRDNTVSSGSLYLAPSELDLLTGRSIARRSRAFSIGVEPSPRTRGAEWEYDPRRGPWDSEWRRW